MLHSYFIKFEFFRFSQAGYYFDFFFKKLSEIFVRNIFLYTALFFGEKYMIEVFTKKIITSTIYKFNNLWSWNQLFYTTFFIQLLSFIFYGLSILNILFFLF